MKKITVLLLLLFALAGYSQDKTDFKAKTKYADSFTISLSKTLKKSISETYAHFKFKAIENEGKSVIKLTDAQKEKMKALFEAQYPVFKVAFDKYNESKTAQSKLDLIKVLLKNEEDFRALLTEEQGIYYKSYDPDSKLIANTNFTYYFMTDKQYYGYKKQLL